MSTDLSRWSYTVTARSSERTEYVAMDIRGVDDIEVHQPGTKRVHALHVKRVTLTYTLRPGLWTITAEVSGTPRTAAWRENRRCFWHNPGVSGDMADWPEWLRSLALRLHPDAKVAGPELARLKDLREAREAAHTLDANPF